MRNNSHLKLNKPIFLKKIRSYNDLFKKENLNFGSSLSFFQKNKLIVKSSFFEKILDSNISKNGFFHFRGGKFFLSKSDGIFNPTYDFIVVDKNFYKNNRMFSSKQPQLLSFPYSAIRLNFLYIFLQKISFYKLYIKKNDL